MKLCVNDVWEMKMANSAEALEDEQKGRASKMMNVDRSDILWLQILFFLGNVLCFPVH